MITHYVPEKPIAYYSWRHRQLCPHLFFGSVPCVYCEVLEKESLELSYSFLVTESQKNMRQEMSVYPFLYKREIP